MTIGERAADLVARNIGRWAFVVGQTAGIAVWMWWNVGGGAFDPYPFILLNLALSLQAAYTGPVLLISSNRADALRSQMLGHVERLAEMIETHTAQMQRHGIETRRHVVETRGDMRRIMVHLGLIEAELGQE